MGKALVIIDIQNDITKNYKDVIGNINIAIDWAVGNDVHVVYIRHENLSDGTRTFKPDTRGAELVPDMKIVSKNVFTKYKGNALTSDEFAGFINKNGIDEFYVTGADAVACVKSTVFNMNKAGYKVNVLSDCITSYDKRKIEEMLYYYERTGCTLISLNDVTDQRIMTEREIKTSIIALEREALEQWNNGNPDRFINLSADDVVYIDPAFENKLEGKKALEDYYNTIRGKIKIDSYRMINPTVQLSSDTAVLTYNYEVHRDGIAFKMNCTEVYRLDANDQWRIIHTHWSFTHPNK